MFIRLLFGLVKNPKYKAQTLQRHELLTAFYYNLLKKIQVTYTKQTGYEFAVTVTQDT